MHRCAGRGGLRVALVTLGSFASPLLKSQRWRRLRGKVLVNGQTVQVTKHPQGYRPTALHFSDKPTKPANLCPFSGVWSLRASITLPYWRSVPAIDLARSRQERTSS